MIDPDFLEVDPDTCDDEAMIFTEADVYGISGYLAEIWGPMRTQEECISDTDEAIREWLAARAKGTV